MTFIDKAKILVKSGDGGKGINTFVKRKNSHYTRADGGSGGKGGDILFRALHTQTTLKNFRNRSVYYADSGRSGGRGCRSGKNGKNLIITVPIGTEIYSGNGHFKFHDLLFHNQEVKIIVGGQGGVGNSKIFMNHNLIQGMPGESLFLSLVLKFVADVGLVGLPNSGKSSLLSVMTAARPKISSYPFTTLYPSLGTITSIYKTCILVDCPPIVKNSINGQGLGIGFMRHLERCYLLIYLLDASSSNIIQDYNIIDSEISRCQILNNKQKIVLLTKIDLLDSKSITNTLNILKVHVNKLIFTFSTKSSMSIEKLKNFLLFYRS